MPASPVMRTRCGSCSGSWSTTHCGTRAPRFRSTSRSTRDGPGSWSATTGRASPSRSASECSNASIAPTDLGRGRAPASAWRSRAGSPTSTPVGSWPTAAARAVPASTCTCSSYDLLRQRRDAVRMYNVSATHAVGLIGGLIALPIALIALRFHPRWRSVPGTVQAAAVLMAVSGGGHLALMPRPLATQPLTSVLFLFNGLAFITLAASFTWRWWRLASAALLVATVFGYLFYVAIGLERPDQGGIAPKLV